MRYAKKLGLAVGVLLFTLAVTYPAYAQEGNVGGKPANPRSDNPRTRSIFVHEIAPGEEVKDAVLIINNASLEKTVLVYPTDAQVASGGAFACEQKADKADEEGSWIDLEKDLVTLGPGKSETVGFTIKVPKNAAVGEHNACIALQAVEPATPSDVSGVQLNFRSAIRVAVTVPGEFQKQLSFESLNINKKNRDTLLVNQALRNSGNVSLDTELDTSIRTIIGTQVEGNGGQYPILAGQRSEFNFDFKRPIWGGFYRVVAIATYNNDPDTSLGEQSSSTDTIKTNKYIFILPHPLVLIGYLLLLGLLVIPFVIRYSQMRRLQVLKARAITHIVIKGEDIKSVSEHYQARWQDTALLNSLKAPYALSSGAKILIAPGPPYAHEKKPTKQPAISKTNKSAQSKKSSTKKNSSARKTKTKS